MSQVKQRISRYKSSFKMKETLPKASAILLMLVLLAVLFNVASMMSHTLSDRSAPKAIKGTLELTKLNLENTNSIPLSGNWSFYWQQLLSPQDIKNLQPTSGYIDVPHAWVRESMDGKPMPREGYATYQLKVTTDSAYPQLAIKVPTMGTAFNLYIDDQLIASAGKVATTPELSEAEYNAQIILFEPQGSSFTVTLQVSNHQFYWGGIWTSPRVAVPEVLYQEELKNTVRTSVLLAIFLTVSLFNLIQFTLRTSDPLPIIIGASCLLLGLREIESSQVLHLAGIVSWTFETNVRLNFLTFYATVPVIVAYFHISFWRDYNARIMALLYTVSTIFSLLVLFTPPEVFSPSMPWFQGFVVLLMPYVFWGLIQAVRNKRSSARLLMIGTLFLFLLVLNDILYNLALINTTLMVGFGLVAFVLCQNYLTYIRFINASRENVLLSETLEERNKELEEFSQSLEEKVNLRTQELEQANEQLEALAHKDMLTDLPNRRGLMIYIEDAMVEFWQKRTPFCLLVLDFDKFKLLNDTFGHEIGDKVLSEGAKLIRQILRDNDVVGRWGGEEFLLMLPNTPTQGAIILADKVRNLIRDSLTEENGPQVSVTIGIAEFMPGDTLDTCIKRADKALYRGKENGRDRVETLDPLVDG